MALSLRNRFRERAVTNAPFGTGPAPLGGHFALGHSAIWGYGMGGYGTGAYGGSGPPKPELLLQTVVTLGEEATEGQIVEAVGIAWFKIVKELTRDPSLMHQINWRKWEEMIAAAYEAQGWDEVILTPRSGDDGRDVIAVRHDFGSIRFVEQVKAYTPGHLVTADDVRSMAGVLLTEPNVSKGIVTTTAEFEPGVYENARLRPLMPTRLDLRNGSKLLEWLDSISKERATKGLLGGP
jgi:restriction system protein